MYMDVCVDICMDMCMDMCFGHVYGHAYTELGRMASFCGPECSGVGSLTTWVQLHCNA